MTSAFGLMEGLAVAMDGVMISGDPLVTDHGFPRCVKDAPWTKSSEAGWPSQEGARSDGPVDALWFSNALLDMSIPGNKAGDDGDGTETASGGFHLRVLIVEDDATTRKLVSQILIREGYEVTTAADGAEAIIQAKHVLPDVMILDLALPSTDPGAGQFDGFGVLRWLDLQLPKNVPTIVLTCRQDEAARREADALGVHRFITKPFRCEELTAAVGEVVNRRSLE